MAIIFHQITGQHGGALPLDVGTDEPVGAIASQGLLVNAAGVVFATLETPPANWCAGLPFDAHGRLVVEEAAVATYSGGLGFTASGALAVTDNAGTYIFNQGVAMLGGAVSASGIGTPPGTVTGLAVTTAGIEQLLLSWDALTAAPPVTNYTVYWRPVGSPTWTSASNGTGTSRTISGLTSGVTYELTVDATNAIGTGPQATPVTGLPISRDSNIVFFGGTLGAGRAAYRMDTSPWTPIDIVPGLANNVAACAYSPTRQLLALGFSTAPYLRVFDASKFPLVAVTVATQPAGAVNWLNFSPDGSLLGVSTGDTFASLVYETTGWTKRDLDTGDNRRIAINAANNRVVIGAFNTTPNGNLQVWDVSGPVPALMAPLPSFGTASPSVGGVACHPTQNILAACEASPGSAPHIYDLTTLTYLGDAPSTTGRCDTLDFSPQGTYFAVGRSTGGSVLLTPTPLNTPASWAAIATANTTTRAVVVSCQHFSYSELFLTTRSVGQPGAVALGGTPPLPDVTAFGQNLIPAGGLTQATFLNMPTPPALPGQVQGLAITPGANQLALSWTALSDPNPVTGYVVQYVIAGGSNYTTVFLGVVTNYTITPLAAATSYDVRVCAFNTGGWGAFTPVQTATTL